MATKQLLIWHSPRVGSNLFCNILHKTGKLGIADYLNCGFPIGSIGKVTPDTFPDKLQAYIDSQTTGNGVFACKLSWEGLTHLKKQVGLEPIMEWLKKTDLHVFLKRQDLTAQAVSLYVAKHRAYYSTTKPEAEALPTPPYDYDEIAFERIQIRAYNAQIKTYFENHCVVNRYDYTYEEWATNPSRLFHILQQIAFPLGVKVTEDDFHKPDLKKQVNPRKDAYIARWKAESRLEW